MYESQSNGPSWYHYWLHPVSLLQTRFYIYDLATYREWLWIATPQGVIQLNQQTMEYALFSHTDTSPDISLRHAYTLAVDDQGQLWASGEYGLVRYSDTEGWKVIYTGESIQSFALDIEDNLWYFKSSGRVVEAYSFQGHEPPTDGDWKPKLRERREEGLFWGPSSASFWESSKWRLMTRATSFKWGTGSVVNSEGMTWAESKESAAYNTILISHNDKPVMEIPLPRFSDEMAKKIVATDTQDGFWIGLNNSLFYSDRQTLKRYQFPTGEIALGYPLVYFLAFAADGDGWAATSAGLFHRSTEGAGKWQNVGEVSAKMPFENSKSIAPDQQGGLWVLGDGYLTHFDGQSWQRWLYAQEILQCEQQPHTIVEFQGNPWIAAGDCGLWRLDGQTWSKVLLPLPPEIILPTIVNLLQGRDGKLYLTVDGFSPMFHEYILVYDGTGWEQLPDCVGCDQQNPSRAITVDTTGSIWKVYQSGDYYRPESSIWRYSADQGWCPVLAKGYVISSILIDTQGGVWYTDYNHGVHHYNSQQGWRFWDWNGNYSGMRPWSFVTILAEDQQGRIWVGGWGLLSVYDPAAER